MVKYKFVILLLAVLQISLLISSATAEGECPVTEDEKFEAILVYKKCKAELLTAMKGRIKTTIETKLRSSFIPTLSFHTLTLIETTANILILDNDELTAGAILESMSTLFHVAVNFYDSNSNEAAYKLKPTVKKDCAEEIKTVCKKSDCCKKAKEQPEPRPCDVNPMMPC